MYNRFRKTIAALAVTTLVGGTALVGGAAYYNEPVKAKPTVSEVKEKREDTRVSRSAPRTDIFQDRKDMRLALQDAFAKKQEEIRLEKEREAARKKAQERARELARQREIAAQKAAQEKREREEKRRRESQAPTYSAPSGNVKQYASKLVGGGAQFSCLDALWNKESGWNHLAQNPSSGAYGIPQSLPGSKMASAGADWRTNPYTQVRWGVSYIKSRYGTACAAWNHSQAHNWY